MKHLLMLAMVLLSGFFVFPQSAYACDSTDLPCQACEIFCFPTTFAEDQYNILQASISAKSPFAYVNAALNFNLSGDSVFGISSLEPALGGYVVHLANEYHDSAIVSCSVFVNGTDRGTSAHLTGGDAPFCTVYWPINTAHDTVFVTLNDSDGIHQYTTPEWPGTIAVQAGSGTESEDVLPLTITLASVSAIPAIGMPAQAGMTFTVFDSGEIHDFLAMYVRPTVTLLLWLLLIVYFWGIAGRIFT